MGRFGVLIACFLPALPLRAATIRVPADHPTIQGALDAAKGGDSVLVAPGRYEIGASLDFNRLAVSVPQHRNFSLVAEAGPAETVLALRPGAGPASVVVFRGFQNSLTRLEGFTLTGGSGTQTVNGRVGGGIQVLGNSFPRVVNCRISGNSASRGGGVHCQDSRASFVDCVIADNAAEVGGGVYCGSGASPTFTDCTISANRQAPPEFSIPSGAGVYCGESSSPSFTGCRISGNQDGGGIRGYLAKLELQNCLISENLARFPGGAMSLNACTVTICSSTIAGNIGDEVGGILAVGSPLAIEGSIVAENVGDNLQLQNNVRAQASYSCIPGGPPLSGTGNIESEPRFCGWGGRGEVHVDAASPPPGDGTPESPYPDLAPALSYRYSLSKDSPCAGADAGGANMGADLGVCEEAGVPARTIHLAPGSYRIAGSTLVHHASLRGSGVEKTEVLGTVAGLRTGARLSRLTVVSAASGGVLVSLADPEIEEVTIRGAASLPPTTVGMDLYRASPAVRKCAIEGHSGAGMVLEDSSPSVSDCRVTGNGAGAVACRGESSPRFDRCSFSENGGPGLASNGGSPILGDCSLTGNSGGGVGLSGGSAALGRCLIAGNGGGALAAEDAQATLVQCRLAGNWTDGAALHFQRSTGDFLECVVSGNVSGSPATLLLMSSTVGVDHSTIAGNSAAASDLSLWGSRLTARSSIFWGNGKGEVMSNGSTWELSHSCREGPAPPPGEGNLNSDPLFCGWTGTAEARVRSQAELESLLAGEGLGLAPGSPCRGAGENGIDMGAAEGTCAARGGPVRIILAAGTYRVGTGLFPRPLALEGAGEDTVLQGDLILRDGDSISRIAVLGGRVLVAPGASARIADCRISDSSGLGLQCGAGSAPVVVSTEFSGHRTGAIRCERGSSPTFEGCAIAFNPSDSGVIWCDGARPRFVDCLIADNSSPGNTTGGVRVVGMSSVSFSRCTFLRNRKRAISFQDSEVSLEDCRLSENPEGGISALGGKLSAVGCEISFNRGQALELVASAEIRNCLIAGNVDALAPLSLLGDIHLVRCTVAANISETGAVFWIAGGGLQGEPVRFSDCIIWDNRGGVFGLRNGAPAPEVKFSCVQGDALTPGPGNLNLDPLFCGWDGSLVHVDASAPPPGDGTSEHPYPDLPSALAYRYALSKASPCLGAGENGADLGAERGRCELAGSSRRTVRLAPGNYPLASRVLVHRASLEGAEAGKSVVEGTVSGLATGARLSRLTVAGGGVRITGGQSPEISDVLIVGRDLPEPAIYAVESAPAILRTRLEECYGPGVRLQGSDAFLEDCHVFRTWGGLEVLASRAKLHRCTISANLGGLSVVGPSTLEARECRLLGNLGNLRVLSGASGTLSNCLILGNTANQGGALFSEGQVTLVNCTISGHRAARGGAIFGPGRTQIFNSILWQNGPQPIDGDAVLEHSLIEGPLWPGAGNTNQDPRFRAPAVLDFFRRASVLMRGLEIEFPDFVVSEGDYRLLAGSPAIDAGAAEHAPDVDLDGNPRPCGLRPDQGAFEECPPAFRRGEANGDGNFDTSDAVVIIGYLFLGMPEPVTCQKSADVDDNGLVDLSDPIWLITYLFLGGPPPPVPFEKCGHDPSPDALGCGSSPSCSGQ